MDLGLRSPMLDFFKRGEVAKDVRLLAASGSLAPRALEQIALLAMSPKLTESEVENFAKLTNASEETLRTIGMIALDRNLQEPLKLAVRKRIAEGQEKK